MNQSIEHVISGNILTIKRSKFRHHSDYSMVEYVISGNILTIEESKLGHHSDYSCDLSNILVKFKYLQHSSQNRYETSISKKEIFRLYPLFKIYPNYYYWVLFEVPSEIIVRVSNVILQWDIEVERMDIRTIEINLQLLTGEDNALINRRI